MLDAIDEYSIANEISVLRDTYRGTVVLVEGADDGRLMEKFRAREDRCRIVPAFGNERALRVLRILRDRGHGHSLLLILDADYWHLTGDTPDDRDIVITDFHDLEMDIAMSDAFDSVLREIGDRERVAELEHQHRVSIRLMLLREAGRIAAVRYANALRGLYLRFRDVDLESFVRDETAVIDVGGYVQAVLEKSHGGVSLGEVLSETANIRSVDSDLAQMVRGHDFAALLAVALRCLIGQCPPDIASPRHVESLLRLAFGREHFDRSALNAAILDWEARTGGVVLD